MSSSRAFVHLLKYRERGYKLGASKLILPEAMWLISSNLLIQFQEGPYSDTSSIVNLPASAMPAPSREYRGRGRILPELWSAAG